MLLVEEAGSFTIESEYGTNHGRMSGIYEW